MYFSLMILCVCVRLLTIRHIMKHGSGHCFELELDKESRNVLCVDVM